jgi:hypothetical protein
MGTYTFFIRIFLIRIAEAQIPKYKEFLKNRAEARLSDKGKYLYSILGGGMNTEKSEK